MLGLKYVYAHCFSDSVRVLCWLGASVCHSHPKIQADVSMEAASLVRFISSAVIVLGSFIGDRYLNKVICNCLLVVLTRPCVSRLHPTIL